MTFQSIISKWKIKTISYQYATAPTSPNQYVACTINNMDLIMTLNKEKKNWTKKYHKIIQGLETMADVQL